MRDKYGMWCHPSFPEWDEETTQETVQLWLSDNDGEFYFCYFQDTASDELVESWFEDGEADCSSWEPICINPNAFLLSIHDTEEAPVAVYFVPNSPPAR